MHDNSSRNRRLSYDTTKALVNWRRNKVVELVSKGKSLSQIADLLKVDVSTISRDWSYIQHNSEDVLEKYFTETAPLEVSKALARLTAVSNEAWAIAEQAATDKNQKLRIAALTLAKDATLNILDVLSNHKFAVEQALKFTTNLEEEKKKLKEQIISIEKVTTTAGGNANSNGNLSTEKAGTVTRTREPNDPEAVF